MSWLRRIIAIASVVGLVVGAHYFVQRNAQAVSLDFVAVGFESVALWMVLLCTFGAGFLLATLLAIWRGARLRLESRRYRKAARSLEAEVHKLRTLPLSPEAADVAAAGAPEAPLEGLERGS
jgi:uncharacterized integral membrane protein